MPMSRNRLASLWVIVFGVIGLALGAGVISLASAKTGDNAEAGPAKPPLPAIESLELEPASLTLADARDARQVIVWGVTKDGQKFDLTDSATIHSESPEVLAIVEGRYIQPVKAGEGTIAISAEGREAKLTVKVVQRRSPVGSVWAGRDAGAGQGRLQPGHLPRLGQGARTDSSCRFAATTRNTTTTPWSNELLGRRVNRVEPEQSLMLLKPIGRRAARRRQGLPARRSRHYNLIQQWIKEGREGRPGRRAPRAEQAGGAAAARSTWTCPAARSG